MKIHVQSNLYQEVNFCTKKKWSYKTGDLLRGSVEMKFSMTGKENEMKFSMTGQDTDDCLIEVTTWSGLT